MTQLKTHKAKFASYRGCHVSKIQAFIEDHLENWELDNETLVRDILDCNPEDIQADDILDALQQEVELQEDNSDFKYAVLAMRISIEKERIQERGSAHSEAYDAEYADDANIEDELEMSDFKPSNTETYEYQEAV